jgi:MscS family membrane protein
VANAAEINPLRPVNTSSPRATLQGFAATMDDIYLGMKPLLQGYETSPRLYLTPDERRRQFELHSIAPKAIKVLDLSDIPSVLGDTSGTERALQLKEILDRDRVAFLREHSGSGSDDVRFIQTLAPAGGRSKPP